ncbi:MAG: hypothetical protein HN778_08020 [Prolixibacteraceae bacterium]|jgi:hypothetical protein|nr:hypothetical protein [Prolixibacteraceae bacterium]MBT6004808.1 hypothetical protein [Prolixibacteraceae bacterium]MBT6766918.1 hypothetical protein [Prolixibacteraceae bacterium]MBT7394763.1 hypothetical protein [Prolixibacteraceae bacterium]
MIKKIASGKNPNFWIFFHATLGIVSTLSPYALIAWFYFILFLSGVKLFSKKESFFIKISYLIFYLTSFEILARMSKTSPYIPYELGKYLMFILLITGIFAGYKKGKTGWFILILLIPGIVTGYLAGTPLKGFIFNVLGTLNIALAIIYFKDQVIQQKEFIAFLRLVIYPIISALAFSIIKTPKYEEIEYSLNASFATTGGFGSNQVATAFGTILFLLFLFIMFRWDFSQKRWMDIFLLLIFTFQGLLSFSRGGILGGLMGITVVLYLNRNISNQAGHNINQKKILIYLIPVILLLYGSFQLANRITNGMLLQRYSGETTGTLSGTREKNLNIITSNRSNIVLEDFKIFIEYPLWGVGVGQSSKHRNTTKGQLPHVEFSRLMSEHGLAGLISFLILSFILLKIYKRRYKVYMGNIMLALFLIAIFTTSHAATRTYISPILIGLSLLIVKPQIKENK